MRTTIARTLTTDVSGRARVSAVAGVAAVVSGLLLLSAAWVPTQAYAADTIELGEAAQYSVLAGATATNVPLSSLDGSLGVSPGEAATGFTDEQVGGEINLGAAAAAGKAALTKAYNDATIPEPANIPVALDGQTLVGGVYASTPGTFGLTQTLTLDGQNDPRSVFIFQMESGLTTAANSSINLINLAQPCNVFWQVGSSATIGSDSFFVGTIMAYSSITVLADATIEGRALAQTGQVSLIRDTFVSPGCDLSNGSSSSSASSVSSSSSSSSSVSSPSSGSSSSSLSSSSSVPSSSSGASSSTATSSSGASSSAPLSRVRPSSSTAASSTAAQLTTNTNATTSSTAATDVNIGVSTTQTAVGANGGGSNATGTRLAYTGASQDVGRLVVLGPLLILTGALLVASGRIRRRTYKPRHAH